MRSPKKRSLLGVNEHFEGKRNAEITLLDGFFFEVIGIYYNAGATSAATSAAASATGATASTTSGAPHEIATDAIR